MRALEKSRVFLFVVIIRLHNYQETNLKKKPEIEVLIGKLIKKERMKQKLSQQDLANLLKVDRQYVWRIENGKINLTLDYLVKSVWLFLSLLY